MWHGIGFLAGLLAIALIVWQAIRLANIKFEIGVGPAMVTAALSVLLLIFTFIRFIDKPGGDLASSMVDRTIWAWLGSDPRDRHRRRRLDEHEGIRRESVQALMDRFGTSSESAASRTCAAPARRSAACSPAAGSAGAPGRADCGARGRASRREPAAVTARN